jgi:hypothetical protein
VKLAKFLEKNKRGDPSAGTAGAESHWLDVGTLESSTGSLWAGDPYTCNAEAGCIVKVPPGIYVIQAKAMDFSGRKRVSRLRVVLQAAGKPSLGKQVGETCTDTATMAVCDIGALDDAVGVEYERFQELVSQHDYQDCGSVRLQMQKPIEMPYVSTGFGDGGFPVFELSSGPRHVGMEVEFIPPGYVVPTSDEDPDAFVGPPEEVECGHCGATGKCYCLRKGPGTAANCVRCSGTGKCRVCGGTGKCWR